MDDVSLQPAVKLKHEDKFFPGQWPLLSFSYVPLEQDYDLNML